MIMLGFLYCINFSKRVKKGKTFVKRAQKGTKFAKKGTKGYRAQKVKKRAQKKCALLFPKRTRNGSPGLNILIVILIKVKMSRILSC